MCLLRGGVDVLLHNLSLGCHRCSNSCAVELYLETFFFFFFFERTYHQLYFSELSSRCAIISMG